MKEALPWLMLAVVIVAAVVIYHLVAAPDQSAKVTLGGISIGGAKADISFDAIDDIFAGFI